MSASQSVIDDLLAAALRDEPAPWPVTWGKDEQASIIDRVHYHGIAGLLVNAAGRNSWPKTLQAVIREEATARAMWDMRNHQALGELFAKLREVGISHVILKGAALAYLAYDSPDQRTRADTDVLVDPRDVAGAREVLRELGYSASWGEMPNLDLAFQEGWELRHADRSVHQLDLHWQAINARSLRDLMPVEDCLTHGVSLPRLSADARTLEPARLLLHTCLHRLMHRTSPYVVGNKTYFGGERLIWAVDIRNLSKRLHAREWVLFTDIVIAAQVAPVCLNAFAYARRTVGLDVPSAQLERLEGAKSDGAATRYLLEFGRIRRLAHNLVAKGGVRSALAFARSQLFPPSSVLRVHYPDGANRPLVLLLMRRWTGFLQFRRRAGS